MALRSSLASAGVKLAASMAIFMACSWKIGTPRVLPRMWRSSSRAMCAGAGEG